MHVQWSVKPLPGLRLQCLMGRRLRLGYDRGMNKQKPAYPQYVLELGEHQFDEDEVDVSDLWVAVQSEKECDALVELYEHGLDVIVAAMWTFEQGMLGTDIVNTRLMAFDINKVWHARYLLSRFSNKPEVCRAVFILDRLKGERL